MRNGESLFLDMAFFKKFLLVKYLVLLGLSFHHMRAAFV